MCQADIRDKAETLPGPLLKKFTDPALEVKEKDREEVLPVPLELVIYSQGFPVPQRDKSRENGMRRSDSPGDIPESSATCGNGFPRFSDLRLASEVYPSEGAWAYPPAPARLLWLSRQRSPKPS